MLNFRSRFHGFAESTSPDADQGAVRRTLAIASITIAAVALLSTAVSASGLPVWTLAATTGPPSLRAGQMVYDSARHKMVVFSDTETWEMDSGSWSRAAATGPSSRFAPAMAYDSARGKTVLFGGWTYIPSPQSWVYYADTWEWDGTVWTQVATTGPPGNWSDISMCYDSTRGKSILFTRTDGGAGPPGTWEWDGATWKEAAAPITSPVSRPTIAFDSARGKTVLFDGEGTWERDSGDWREVATTGPAFREGAAMAYDSVRGRTVLFGGHYTNHGFDAWRNDTWEWDGARWTLASVSLGPDARAWATMAFDSVQGKIVLFGGQGSFNVYSDTWTYVGPLAFTIGDAASALSLAAGFRTAAKDDVRLFDVDSTGRSAGLIDILDAIHIARKAAGLDSNP